MLNIIHVFQTDCHLRYVTTIYCYKCNIVVVIVGLLDLQLPVQSVYITTKIVNSSPVDDEVYSIQHYMIKFVSDLRWFYLGNPVSSTNKTDRQM